ncbi:MAG: hypothetical protein IT304_01790 [Dehalococcoidia bacterium]|nr:hypothetical protein [Dehalococcoidia bacterium]
MHRCRAGPILTALGVSLLAACSGSEGPPPAAAVSSPTPAATATVIPRTTTASPSPLATPSPTQTATPTATLAPAAARAAVLQAAATVLNARLVSPLSRDACLAGNPAGQLCIELVPAAQDVTRGLARFVGGDPAGGAFRFVMGRTADGAWQFWFGTQQNYSVTTTLPGDALACGGSHGVAIRQQPAASAAVVVQVQELAPLRLEEFVLTRPGSFPGSGSRGEGWYRVSAPAAGWVEAGNETDAANRDCKLRDAMEGVRSVG